MTEAEWPYNLPIWQRSLRLESPDGALWAEIKKAYEVSMGNPTMGTLVLSSGVVVERCNPSFVWSDDSRYLAVPQYTRGWLGGTGRQRLLVIAVHENSGWLSSKLAYYFQPETFEKGELTLTLNPFRRKPRRATYTIPDDLELFEGLSLTRDA